MPSKIQGKFGPPKHDWKVCLNCWERRYDEALGINLNSLGIRFTADLCLNGRTKDQAQASPSTKRGRKEKKSQKEGRKKSSRQFKKKIC